MKNKTLRTSYISFTILIILLILEIIMIDNRINSYGTYIRGSKVILSYFFHLPLFIINLILAIKVLQFYLKNKFKKPLKAFYFVIPSFIFYICCIIYLINDII
ncbi:hypothetical protein OA93_05560 [Flavobacterium sp. KMS]|nr:hypothetical protein OA93_05560 [Flavobacterium sp. KMS]